MMKFSVRLLRVLGLLLVATSPLTASAQDAVPAEILKRTRLVKCGNLSGTAFAVDYNLKVYLVTARHIAAGLPRTEELRQFAEKQGWTVAEEFVDTASGSGRVERPAFDRMMLAASQKRFDVREGNSANMDRS